MIETNTIPSEAARTAASLILKEVHIPVGESLQCLLNYLSTIQGWTQQAATVTYVEEIISLVCAEIDEATAIL